MPETIPDLVTVEVLWQGQGLPCRVRLETPGGGLYNGALDLAALRARLDQAEDVWVSGAPASYGRTLFEGLFPGELAYQYGLARGAAGARGIRLLLQLDEQAADLYAIHWERLYQPRGDGWAPLAAAPDLLFSRYLPAGASWASASTSGILRVLAVVSAPFPTGHPLYVDGDQERGVIERTFRQFAGRVQCDLLAAPVTLEAIASALDTGTGYDVFHYAGHGAWDVIEGQAYLLLEEPAAEGIRAKRVSEREIVDRLRMMRRPPALIALFACESAGQAAASGTITSTTAAAFTGLGPRLVQAGCPAVVCMQGRVEADVARRFAESFYAELLSSGIVDRAVNRGRTSVYERWAWQWALPVLFMRLANGVLFQPERRLMLQERRPYKGLLPYTTQDAELFYGRAAEIADVCGRIADFPLVVIRGEPGIGLSSLLAAGVGPKLSQEGDLVALVDEYENLPQAVRADLARTGAGAALRLAGDATLAQILQAAAVQPGRRLVLMLDQAERIFDLSPEAQERVFDDVAHCLEVLEEGLRIVFGVHEDADAVLNDGLRPLCRWPLDRTVLRGLSREAAEQAIIEPLKALNWPITLVPQTLAKQIVRDLLEEELQKNDRVDPDLLQVVCTRLYREATQPMAGRAVTNELYRKVNHADGILTSHAEEMLSQLGADRAIAEKILAGMAAVRTPWVTEDQLAGIGQPAAREGIWRRLEDQKLVIRRYIDDDRRAWTFRNRVVADWAGRLQGTEEQRKADNEVDRIWYAWGDRRALASAGQLRHLQHLIEHGASPKLSAPKALLLLRSAVTRNAPPDTCLGWINDTAMHNFVAQVETPAAPTDGNEFVGSTAAEKGSAILGAEPPESGAEARSYGVIAQTAVTHADSSLRRTCALALTALGPADAVNRLGWALETQKLSRVRKPWRRIEMRAGLIDARPASSEFRAGLSFVDRAGVWGWRVWRRIGRDRHRIAGLTLGGAMGAGIALALLRLMTGVLLSRVLAPGMQMAWGLYVGFLLGGALACGILIADTLLPAHLRISDRTPVDATRLRKVGAFGVGFGALFFAVVHVVIAWLAELQPEDALLMLTMGLIAGLGLSGAVHLQTLLNGWRSILAWGSSVCVAILGFAIAHALFLLPQEADPDTVMAIVIPGSFYCASGLPRCGGNPTKLIMLGIADASLVGAFLAVGLMVGLLLAEQWLGRWSDTIARAGD
jgi:hypothetical protein